MYQNILVINLMHIGDLMLVTPVLRTLRANYPAARLTLMTYPLGRARGSRTSDSSLMMGTLRTDDLLFGAVMTSAVFSRPRQAPLSFAKSFPHAVLFSQNPGLPTSARTVPRPLSP